MCEDRSSEAGQVAILAKRLQASSQLQWDLKASLKGSASLSGPGSMDWEPQTTVTKERQSRAGMVPVGTKGMPQPWAASQSWDADMCTNLEAS